ncbi:hypothetical protein [Dysgonomonas sp. 25]|uniref:Cbp1 family collagen-binding glycoprotein adhesin n=1 Tax=Dysgonomonas sp. 25 TaxID=2302933 RepID=UPI0013D6F1EA|nr:hypothetical protein [Dysgonomonas sp. 25]NDV67454.1 hypothetical protein [Dysgonomonas sp. 25]
MKKVLIGCICIGLLASCNVKNSEEYKRLEAERDSLAQMNAEGATELKEMMAIISDVEEGFDQIRTAENYLAVQSKESGKLSQDKRAEINSNITMINEILKKNKEDIAKLNSQLKNSKNNSSGLQATIKRLNEQLAERALAINELQEALQKRDAQILQLQTDVQDLSDNVQILAEKNELQADKIKEQEVELNTAYYMFGTKNELKEAKVITGGFLASTKVLNEGIEKDKFITIDIRNVEEIPVYAKKAKILSDHPKGSYGIGTDATGNAVIRISDYQRFWSISRFLIVQVD